MPKSCCAVGCKNHSMMAKKYSFFTFPKDPDRWEKWVNALKRVNPDGTKWRPHKETVVCSDHFLTGKPKPDPEHPDYIPSLFKHCRSDEKTIQSKLRRFNSAVKRKISFSPLPAKRQALVSQNENIPQYWASPLHQSTIDVKNNSFAISLPTEKPAIIQTENEPEYWATPLRQPTPLKGLGKPVTSTEREQLYLEIDNLRKERDDLQQENVKLKEDIDKTKMNSSSVEENEEKCKFYTGLGWSVFIRTFQFLVSFVKPTPLSRKICLRDQFFITLVKLRLDLPFELIGDNVNISTSQASEIFWHWIELINFKMDFLIKWPDRETIFRTLPGPFKSKFPRLTSIIDCFEIFIERPKKLSARAKCYSNYKKHSTVKVLIACTPNGAISFLSKAWGGRVSDVEIVRQSGFINPNLHLPNDQILADRGFTLKDDFAAVCSAELIIPAFTKGKRQLSAQEVEISRRISSVRIHVERVIGLMKCRFKVLQGTLPIPVIKSLNDESDEHDLSRIDKLLRACAICVNLGDSIVYNEGKT